MTMSLKPCPFCGAGAEVVSATMGILRSMGYAVRCTGCGVQTETDFNQGRAVTQWESRVPSENQGFRKIINHCSGVNLDTEFPGEWVVDRLEEALRGQEPVFPEY